MRNPRPTFGVAAALLTTALLSSCGGGGDEAPPPAPKSHSRLSVDTGVEVPTEEEAERAAKEQIDRKNFDSELEKLAKEIEGDQ